MPAKPSLCIWLDPSGSGDRHAFTDLPMCTLAPILKKILQALAVFLRGASRTFQLIAAVQLRAKVDFIGRARGGERASHAGNRTANNAYVPELQRRPNAKFDMRRRRISAFHTCLRVPCLLLPQIWSSARPRILQTFTLECKVMPKPTKVVGLPEALRGPYSFTRENPAFAAQSFAPNLRIVLRFSPDVLRTPATSRSGQDSAPTSDSNHIFFLWKRAIWPIFQSL